MFARCPASELVEGFEAMVPGKFALSAAIDSAADTGLVWGLARC